MMFCDYIKTWSWQTHRTNCLDLWYASKQSPGSINGSNALFLNICLNGNKSSFPENSAFWICAIPSRDNKLHSFFYCLKKNNLFWECLFREKRLNINMLTIYKNFWTNYEFMRRALCFERDIKSDMHTLAYRDVI